MGSPRPRTRKLDPQIPVDKKKVNAAPGKQNLVDIVITLPGFKPIQGILSTENFSPVEISQIIEDAHILIRDLFLNVQRDGK